MLAGSIAKALAFAQAAGRDAHVVRRASTWSPSSGPGRRHRPGHRPDPGHVQPRRAFEATSPTASGRRSPSAASTRAGSPVAESATEFLLAQQCEEGFFRQDFAAIDAADQSCDADPASAAVHGRDRARRTRAAAAGRRHRRPGCHRRRDRLAGRRAGGGRLASAPARTSRPPTPTAPAWPAGRSVRPATSRRRSERLHGCAAARSTSRSRAPPSWAPTTGAIAYDTAALAAGRADGITVELEDQWRRASAQALPVAAVGAGRRQWTDHADRHQRLLPGRHQGHARRRRVRTR